MTQENKIEAATADTKQWRKDLDEVLQRIKDQSCLNQKCDSSYSRKSSERSLAVTKLQEAIMWLGMDLKDIGETPNPYPHSYDPASPVIEPTAPKTSKPSARAESKGIL